ncbi:MAG: carotenoid 1,2-hydratase [Pseudomonadota bacterium]
MSDDGTRAVSVIAFIGSVFSPWYAWSGRKRPQNHCCINVATYGPGGRFTMTDRGERALKAEAHRFQVGPSQVRWTGKELLIEVNEWAAPPHIGARVTGTIVVVPNQLYDAELALTEDDAHIWRPFAPTSRISVYLNGPGWQWDGHGYFDANFGTRALEADFSYWTWGRFPSGDGSVCFYDADRRDGTSLAAGIRFDDHGAHHMELPPKRPLRRTLWTLYRETRGDQGCKPRQVKAMLDAPFYSRAAVETVIDGKRTVGVHEALDLNRFRSPLLKPMLAVRVPRWTGKAPE